MGRGGTHSFGVMASKRSGTGCLEQSGSGRIKIRIRNESGLGRPSAKSRGGKRTDGAEDHHLPNCVGDVLGPLEPNGNGAP